MAVLVVGCLLHKDGRFLVLRRAADKTQPNTWAVPGGKVDPGESLEQALIRETFEETGYQISDDTARHVHEVYHEFDETDKVQYHVFWVDVDTHFEPALSTSEHSDWSWKSLKELESDPDTIDTNTEIIRYVLSNEPV